MFFYRKIVLGTFLPAMLYPMARNDAIKLFTYEFEDTFFEIDRIIISLNR